MEIKTTEQIRSKYISINHGKFITILPYRKWVAVDDLIHNIKMMREIWVEDNLNEDDFNNFIKELTQNTSKEKD